MRLVNSKVRDLSPLAALKQLNSLSINTYHIKNLDQIKDLKQLESLSLYNLDSNKDMDFLKHMPNLNHIGISRSDIEDYAFLYSLPKLNSLYISNGIKDLSFLGGLTNLEYLNLSSNSIEDLSPISELTNLKELDVGYNMVKDLGPLKELKQLIRLEANYNFIESLKGLEDCKSLQIIHLNENNIEDISPLSGLNNLRTLLISDNIISDIGIVKDIKSLNRIDIEGNPVVDITPIIEAGVRSSSILSLDKIEEAGRKAHKIIKDIIDEDMTDLDKEKVIYGYLIDNIEYDHQYYKYGIPTRENPGGIYGALIHGWAICDGYAHAMKVLGRLAGLDCIYISGDITCREGHAWNMINLDGTYYHLDATWDDGGNNIPIEDDGILGKTRYFNVSHNYISIMGQRIWSYERFPKADATDPILIDYCKENNLQTDDFYFIEGNIKMGQPPRLDMFISLNVDILDSNNNIKYSTSEIVQVPAGKTRSSFQIRLPEDINFKYYNIDYNIHYKGDDYTENVYGIYEFDFLETGYITKDGTSLTKEDKENIRIGEKVDVNIVSYSLYEPYSDDYGINYLDDDTWDDLASYSITNVRELTLPPYSAVLYSADHHNHDYMGYNVYKQGYLLSFNNTNKDKTFKPNEIFCPLYGIVSPGMSIYYSIIIFDDYFDEMKLRQGRGFEVDNAVYNGRWVYDGLVPDKPKKDNTVPDDPITDIENNTIHNGNQMNNGMVIEKDGFYYYSKSDENYEVALVKASIDTGKETTIYNGTAYGLQTIGEHLYFYNDKYGLMRINLATNALETVVDINKFQDGCTGWYYIFEGDVYYQSRVGYNLYKINLDTLATSLVSENNFHYLNVVGDDIYYRNEIKNGNTNISRYNLLTGEDSIILQAETSNVMSDGKYLYYSVYGQSQKTGRDSYSIYRVNMDGSDVVKLYETESRIRLRNIDNYGNIYLLFNDEGIYKMSIVGFPEVKLEKISSDFNITTVIIGERQIYLFRGYYDPLEIINQNS